MEAKTCNTCKQLKPLVKNNNNCRECYNARRRELAKGAERQKRGVKKRYMESKKCTKCNKTKPLSDYCVKTYAKCGLNSQCRQCAAIYQRRVNWKPKRPHKDGQKVCAGCNETKDYSAFPRSRSSSDGYVHKCKACYTTTKKANMEINYASFYYPVALD